MDIQILDEISPLRSVIVGIGQDIQISDINPRIVMHRGNGTLPKQTHLCDQLETLVATLEQHNIEVYRPNNISGREQVFPRDIGFVIGNTFVIGNMQMEQRGHEIDGISEVIQQIPSESLLRVPTEATLEGGDVIVHNDYIFVGVGNRTNDAGYQFLKDHFPSKEVIPLYIRQTTNYQTNVLHVDCAFQPVGKTALCYLDGFTQKPQALYDLFDGIEVNQAEFMAMAPNVLSLDPETVISSPKVPRINKLLRLRGLNVIELAYTEPRKLSGLYRCSTLPLYRGNP